MILSKNHVARKLWAVIKKINEIFINSLNFVLLVPVYYIGIGLAHLSWKIFHKRNIKLESDWKDSPKLSQKLEDYKKHY